MRSFEGGVAVEVVGGDTLRIVLKSTTGERVYHDLKPGEAEAIREGLDSLPTPTPHAAAPEATEKSASSRRKSGKGK